MIIKKSKEVKLSDRVREEIIDGCHLYMLKTSVDSVVSFSGSILTNPDFESGEDFLQDIAVSLLDKGSSQRNKLAIAADLEMKGAEIRFNSGGTRIGFSGQCLSKNVSSVLSTTAEQLRYPAFEEHEYDNILPRMQASVMQSMESTSAQAGAGLRRLLFKNDHPNYSYSPEEELGFLKSSTIDPVRTYYNRISGATDLVLVVVGDIDYAEIIDAVRVAFGGWESQNLDREYPFSSFERGQDSVAIPMNDRQNADVRIGQVIQMTRNHSDFLPLYLGCYVFGGNFSSRLMDTIRDQEGLTYGIYSSLAGIASSFCGYFVVQASFSLENLDLGIRRTNDLISEFVENGVTASELESKKRTVSGSYKVGLASTGSLAHTLALNVARGLGVSYVDDFPGLVADVTLPEVNAAINTWLSINQMRRAVAGQPHVVAS